MADRSVLDLILRVIKQGKGDKEAVSGLEKVQKAAKASLKTLANLTTAAAGVGVVLKKAFDLGEQLAAMKQTRESFTLLLDKIGAAPDLLNRLNNAADRTISEQRLMASVATLVAGAEGDLARSLADATPQLLQIARAANKLNPSLGSTEFLFQSLATGIKRASPQILDNLGLTIKVGDAYAVYARQLGKSANELTSVEQKQALLNAALDAGDTLIDQVGGDVSSATDVYSKLGASLENTAEKMEQFNIGGKTVGEWLDRATKSGLGLVDNLGNLADGMAGLNRGLVATNDTYEDYLAAVQQAKQENLILSPLIERISEAEFNQAKGADAAARANEAWAARMRGVANAELEIANASKQVPTTVFTRVVADTKVAQRRLQDILAYLYEIQGTYTAHLRAVTGHALPTTQSAASAQVSGQEQGSKLAGELLDGNKGAGFRPDILGQHGFDVTMPGYSTNDRNLVTVGLRGGERLQATPPEGHRTGHNAPLIGVVNVSNEIDQQTLVQRLARAARRLPT